MIFYDFEERLNDYNEKTKIYFKNKKNHIQYGLKIFIVLFIFFSVICFSIDYFFEISYQYILLILPFLSFLNHRKLKKHILDNYFNIKRIENKDKDFLNILTNQKLTEKEFNFINFFKKNDRFLIIHNYKIFLKIKEKYIKHSG